MNIMNYIRQKKNEARARKIGAYAKRSQYNEKAQIDELVKIEKEKAAVRKKEEELSKLQKKNSVVRSGLERTQAVLKAAKQDDSNPFSPRNAAPSGSDKTRSIFGMNGGSGTNNVWGVGGGGRNPFYDTPKNMEEKKRGKTITIRVQQ